MAPCRSLELFHTKFPKPHLYGVGFVSCWKRKGPSLNCCHKVKSTHLSNMPMNYVALTLPFTLLVSHKLIKYTPCEGLLMPGLHHHSESIMPPSGINPSPISGLHFKRKKHAVTCCILSMPLLSVNFAEFKSDGKPILPRSVDLVDPHTMLTGFSCCSQHYQCLL